MPTPTYTPLATVTLGSTASSVTFSSIPATYRDLIVVWDGTISSPSSTTISFRFNGDTGANYSSVYMFGSGASTASGTNLPNGMAFQQGAGGVINAIATVMDYSATDKHKTWLSRSNSTADLVMAWAGRWANTAAITSVALIPSSSTFASGNTFSLYGVIA